MRPEEVLPRGGHRTVGMVEAVAAIRQPPAFLDEERSWSMATSATNSVGSAARERAASMPMIRWLGLALGGAGREVHLQRAFTGMIWLADRRANQKTEAERSGRTAERPAACGRVDDAEDCRVRADAECERGVRPGLAQSSVVI